MKSFVLILTLLTCISSFSKGASGYYFIEGTAYSAAKTILSDALITVQHNGVDTDYMTDSKGRFRIKIKWIVPCKSGMPQDQWANAEKRLNEETIHIYFKCQGTELSNQWKIYSGVYENSVRGAVRKTDIHFKN